MKHQDEFGPVGFGPAQLHCKYFPGKTGFGTEKKGRTAGRDTECVEGAESLKGMLGEQR